MLLEQLINDFQLNENHVIKIIDKIGNGIISEKKLLRGFNDVECEAILKVLVEGGVIKESYRYYCPIDDDFIDYDGIIHDFVECENCGSKLLQNEHKIIKIYQNNGNNLLNLIQEYKNAHILKFIDKSYFLNLEELKNDIKNGTVVPFLGAGVSIPLGLPNWSGLIENCGVGLDNEQDEEFKDYLKDGKIFDAIRYFLDHSKTYNLLKFKEKISSYIDEKYVKENDHSKHNILDIVNLNPDFYITTNYDSALKDYTNNHQLLLQEITNMQAFLTNPKGKIIHLHGMDYRPETMIVSKEDYDEMYSKESLKNLFSNILTKKLMFIGYSFDDDYFVEMYESLIKDLKGEHYIILFDVKEQYEKKLLESNLKVINLKLKKNRENYNRVGILKEVFKFVSADV